MIVVVFSLSYLCSCVVDVRWSAMLVFVDFYIWNFLSIIAICTLFPFRLFIWLYIFLLLLFRCLSDMSNVDWIADGSLYLTTHPLEWFCFCEWCEHWPGRGFISTTKRNRFCVGCSWPWNDNECASDCACSMFEIFCDFARLRLCWIFRDLGLFSISFIFVNGIRINYVPVYLNEIRNDCRQALNRLKRLKVLRMKCTTSFKGIIISLSLPFFRFLILCAPNGFYLLTWVSND